ncbi:hypothetical protein B0H10DRAFT_2368155 [Mycena sp. CBHHK59/15]|nr:hypothetical protein B0H10DRAFT_2368155 [Mycena sp. CBHHK59/15]
MVVTCASSSPRTSPRSRSSRSSGASSCSSSSSAPPAALCSASACRRRLEAKHTQLYPTTARLGIRGTKAIKRRIVQRRILEKLELFSPYPPEDLALPYNHQGHRLTSMRLRSGYTQNDRWFAGSYHQVYSTAPSPSPSPSPAPAPSPPASPSPVPAPLPADPAAKEAELPIPPHTPMHQTLHFHYGVPPTEPIEIALDVCTPVLLIAWYLNADTSCTNTICTMVYPRAKEDENPFTACIIANLVLQDFPRQPGSQGSSSWLSDPALPRRHQSLGPCLLDDEIPIFGHNRVIYIRTVGLDVTPPDHFVELFPSISANFLLNRPVLLTFLYFPPYLKVSSLTKEALLYDRQYTKLLLSAFHLT